MLKQYLMDAIISYPVEPHLKQI